MKFSSKIIASLTNEAQLRDPKYAKYIDSEQTERVITTRDLPTDLDKEEEELKNFIDLEFKLV